MIRIKQKSGMTLVELMMVIGILTLLTAVLVPAVNKAMEYKENSEVAHKLRTAIQAFELYRSEEGSYPGDVNRAVVPTGMDEFFGYFKNVSKSDQDRDGDGEYTILDWWSETTEIGGKFDWENHGGRQSISIPDLTIDQDQLEDLDRMIDDRDRSSGNFSLSSGNFRWIGNRYHYVLEE